MHEGEEKSRMKALAKAAEAVKDCSHFGDWDWCNVNCDSGLYVFCDQVFVAQNAEKASKK